MNSKITGHSHPNFILFAVMMLLSASARCADPEAMAKVDQILKEGMELQIAGVKLKKEKESIDKTEKSLQTKDAALKAEERKLENDAEALKEKFVKWSRDATAHNARQGSIKPDDQAAVSAYNTEKGALETRRTALTKVKDGLVARREKYAVDKAKLPADTMAAFAAKKENNAKSEEQNERVRQWREKLRLVLDSDIIKDLKMREALSREAAAKAEGGNLEGAVKILKKVWDGAK